MEIFQVHRKYKKTIRPFCSETRANIKHVQGLSGRHREVCEKYVRRIE
jgi:hypothetical protein